MDDMGSLTKVTAVHHTVPEMQILFTCFHN